MHALLIDIGNTSLKIGVAGIEGLVASYTLPTDTQQSGDGLGLQLAYMALCGLVVFGLGDLVLQFLNLLLYRRHYVHPFPDTYLAFVTGPVGSTTPRMSWMLRRQPHPDLSIPSEPRMRLR